jgi:hypothetical protein
MARETATATKLDSEQQSAAAAAGQQPTVKWDDANLRSTYANVANVSSTREEVILLFGINQAWARGQSQVTVQLTDRVILSPFAAKRLATLLNGVVGEYEKRFGSLDPQQRANPSSDTVQ